MRKKLKSWLCVLLAAVIVTTTLGVDGLAVYASGKERTFDIGVNPESVTATLDENGLLTVSGSGDIKDYTPETAPFQDCFVTQLKLGADVDSIGSYAFYNCGGLSGTVELPQGLVRIGDGAFSGDSPELAPKPTFVKNPFTEARVTKKKDEAGEASENPEQTPEPSAEPTASPQPAGEESSAAAPETKEKTSDKKEAAPETKEAAPETKEAAQKAKKKNPGEAEEGTVLQAGEEAHAAALNQGQAATPAPTAAPTPAAPEPTGSPAPETSVPEISALETSKPDAASATVSPSPKAEGNKSEKTDPEGQTPGEQTPEGENKYLIETVTQQEIGQGIFFPCGDRAGTFTCSAENESFRSAMTAAGYREAENVITAAFDCGEGTSATGQLVTMELPVLDGGVVLPDALPEFSAPDGGDLCAYTFGGWTESRDEANLARPAGSVFPVEDKVDLFFIANWTRRALVKIAVERREDKTTFSVPEVDGYEFVAFQWQSCSLSVGLEPPADQELLGWEDIPGATGQRYEREPAPGDEGLLFRCVVTLKKRQSGLFALFSLGGEEELALDAVRGAAFRQAGVLTCLKGAHEGAVINGEDFTVAAGGNGYVTIPEAEDHGLSCTGVTNLVFNGWQGSDGAVYDPGMIVKLPEGGLTLTAQWAVASVVYVRRNADQDRGGSGTEADPYYSLQEALASSSLKGDSVYTNYIVLLSNLEDEKGIDIGFIDTDFDHVPTVLTPACGAVTITGWDVGATSGSNWTLTSDSGDYNADADSESGGFVLDGDIRFKNITLKRGTNGITGDNTRRGDDLYAQGNKLIMGKGVAISGNMALFGGNKLQDLTSGSPVMIVKSGTYTGIFGGNYKGSSGGAAAQVHLSGNTTVHTVAGEALGNVYGGSQQAGSHSAGADVRISGGTYNGNIYGGGQAGDSIGICSVVITGNAQITGSVFGGCMGGSDANENPVGNVTGDTSVFVSGSSSGGSSVGGGVYGGGQGEADRDNGNVSGNASVAVADGCTVGGGVFGGCQNGDVNGSATAKVIGGTVTGSVFGGGEHGAINGTGINTVTVTGGTVNGSVYGGGEHGDLLGSGSVTLSDAANVGGSVYGGGDQGAVAANTAVTLSGGTVAGNVFGGGQGAAPAADGTPSQVGKVSGSAQVTVSGGRVGTYTGDGDITLAENTGGVFGGGEFAPVAGDSAVVVDIAGESADPSHDPVGNVYGGGSRAQVEGTSSATLQNGTVRDSLYGGGLGSESVSGNASASVTNGTVRGSVYGGGARGKVTGETTVTLSGGTVNGSVFGAGQGGDDINDGRVGLSSGVTVTDGTVLGSVYGGGDRAVVGSGTAVTIPAVNGDVSGNSTDASSSVALSGGTVNGSVFGGGSGSGSAGVDLPYGTVFGSTDLSVTGGTIGGSVYGGCNFAYVTNATNVTVDASAKAVTVGGSAFGGGNMDGNPAEGYKTDAPLIFGGSTVRLVGPNLSIDGGLFGSGNLTTVNGVRNVSVEGFPDGLTLTAIQRADMAKILNSKLTVVGEIDKSLPQETPYSLTRIGDLRVQNSTLCLQAEVRELHGMSSLDASGNPTTAADPVNTVQAAPGLLICVRYTDDSGANVYGNVSGVFWLEMARKLTRSSGVRVEAGTASDVGTGTAPTTGAFLRKESDLNLDPISEPGETDPYLALTSGDVGSSYHFWRLGSAIVHRELILTAPRAEAAGITAISEYLNIPTSESATVYKITGVRRTSGSFNLVFPTETGGNLSFSLGQGQTADSTFALRVTPTAEHAVIGWDGLDANRDDWGAYFLTELPAGQADWNSGVAGVWKRGTSYPATPTTGDDGEVTFTLAYEGAYNNFSGGELEITFKEYLRDSAMTEDAVQNTVVVNLTLKGEEGDYSQTAAVAQGRTFSQITSAEPAAITPEGAVTASFLTKYTPLVTGADHIYLDLFRLEADGTAVSQAFPAMTRIVFGDMTSPVGFRYFYWEAAEGQSRVALDAFSGCDGKGSYAGPSVIGEALEEHLLFAVDFSGISGAGLSQGNYFLTLSHGAGQAAESGARAQFSINQEQSASLTLEKDTAATTSTVWGILLTPSVSPKDTRYTDGACIRVSLERVGGTAVSIPPKTVVGGPAENVLYDQSGTVSFTLPSAGASAVTFDFSGVPESMLNDGEYQLTATMAPRAGLQLSSDQGVAVSPNPSALSFTLSRGEKQARSIGVSLTGGSQRLVDVSGSAASLGFALQCQNLQTGDYLEAELLQKTGTTPDSSSYTALADSTGWSFSPAPGTISGSGGTVTLTVPQGAGSGTYRVLFRIVNSSGSTVAEEPYNFIIK